MQHKKYSDEINSIFESGLKDLTEWELKLESTYNDIENNDKETYMKTMEDKIQKNLEKYSQFKST